MSITSAGIPGNHNLALFDLHLAQKCSKRVEIYLKDGDAARMSGREVMASIEYSFAVLEAKAAATWAFMARPDLREAA